MEITTMIATAHGHVGSATPACESTLWTLGVADLGSLQGTGLSVDRDAKPFGRGYRIDAITRPSHVVVPTFGRPPV